MCRLKSHATCLAKKKTPLALFKGKRFLPDQDERPSGRFKVHGGKDGCGKKGSVGNASAWGACNPVLARRRGPTAAALFIPPLRATPPREGPLPKLAASWRSAGVGLCSLQREKERYKPIRATAKKEKTRGRGRAG